MSNTKDHNKSESTAWHFRDKLPISEAQKEHLETLLRDLESAEEGSVQYRRALEAVKGETLYLHVAPNRAAFEEQLRSLRTKSQLGDMAEARHQEATSSSSGVDTEMIFLESIKADANTESRELNPQVVEDYIECMGGWKDSPPATFPPIVVFKDGDNVFLADGFHRVAAARECKLKTIEAIVYHGDRISALKHSLSANESYGYRRTREDKVYAVSKAFREFPDETSSRYIAALCKVSPTFVEKCRSCATVHVGSSPETRVGKDGKRRRLPVKRKKASASNNRPHAEPNDTGLESQDLPKTTVTFAPTIDDTSLDAYAERHEKAAEIHGNFIPPPETTALKETTPIAKSEATRTPVTSDPDGFLAFMTKLKQCEEEYLRTCREGMEKFIPKKQELGCSINAFQTEVEIVAGGGEE